MDYLSVLLPELTVSSKTGLGTLHFLPQNTLCPATAGPG